MKTSRLKTLALGLLAAGSASTNLLHAQALTEVTVSGGNASSTVCFTR
jgi:hypothetical protein